MGKSLESSRAIERKDSYSVTRNLQYQYLIKVIIIINLEKSKDTAVSNLKAIESKKLELTHLINSSWKKIESTKASIQSLEISVDSNEMAVEGVIQGSWSRNSNHIEYT